MWSVAPESATSKDVVVTEARNQTDVGAGGFLRRARTVLGRYTVLTPCGSVDGCKLVRLCASETEEAVEPPVDRRGPPMGISVVMGEAVGGKMVAESAESDTGSKATLQQDGVDEYTELALDLPPIPYIAPLALPS